MEPDPPGPTSAHRPAPIDDGACDHLRGASLPRLALVSTRGRHVSLRDESLRADIVVFAYPRTGVPGKPALTGWDEIPGARGCTPQACGYRDAHAGFREAGVAVFGLSVQEPGYQREMASRLALPFEVLSDEEHRLQKALRLPTFDVGSERLLKRVTFVARNGRIVHVTYPVFPPERDAHESLAWLQAHPSR